MSFLKDHPELHNEIIGRELIAQGLVDDDDKREWHEIVYEFFGHPRFREIQRDAEANYWGKREEEYVSRRKERMQSR